MDSASFFNFIIASSSNPVKLSKKHLECHGLFSVFPHNPEQYLSNAFAMHDQAHGEKRDTGRNLTISPFFSFQQQLLKRTNKIIIVSITAPFGHRKKRTEVRFAYFV